MIKVLCVVVMTYLCNSFVLHPIYFPRTTRKLPPSSNSDPGLHGGPSSPLPTSARAFIPLVFIGRRLQHFLPWSTRVNCSYPRC